MKCGVLGLFALAPAIALAGKDTGDRRSELGDRQGELRGRIESLRRDLAKSEEARGDAADQLRDIESAISDADRQLHRLAESRVRLKSELRMLDDSQGKLDRQISAQQNHLSRLLVRQFTRGDSDALQLLLAGRDPNQNAMDGHFLARLSKAKAELIADLRTKLAEKRRLAEAMYARQEELVAIEKQQQQGRDTLLERQQQRRTVLANIADRIRSQRKEIGALLRDERRLGRLIEGLSRIVHRPARPAPATRPPAAAALPASPVPAVEPPSGSGEFPALKGRLRLPVRGEIAGRFGQPRPEGGSSWKGLFIRAGEGAEVRAVSAGRVVYADWLRGFGNLLVIDHGDDFLSVYGNNQSLLRETGESVKAGEPVATVGASGGMPESGLYFELRHKGRPLDPLSWAGGR